MFWFVAFLFWFSLLFGAHFVGNGAGTIALFALVVMLILRRRHRSAPPTTGAAPRREAALAPPATSIALAARTTSPRPALQPEPPPRHRWR